MKIAYVSQPIDKSLPSDPGGAIGIWTWEVARRMAKMHEVTVVGPRARIEPPTARHEEVSFARVTASADRPFLKLADRIRPLARERPWSASGLYYRFYARNAARACRQLNCDIIHVHNFVQFVRPLRRLNRHAKIILHMNSNWMAELDREYLRPIVAAADAIFGASDSVTEPARSRFPEFANRFATVFNGVDIDRFHPADEHDLAEKSASEERILYIGRISPEKGVHVLFDSLGRVFAERPRARIDLIGAATVPPLDYIVGLSNDPMVQELKRFYHGPAYIDVLRGQLKDQYSDRVSFIGEMRHEELRHRLRTASVLVQPSLVETFGMPVAEAMASGIATVATRAGGLPELLDNGVTGYLVERNSPDELANALIRILSDPERSRKMGAAGRARAERMFSWDQITQRLTSCYSALLKGAAIPS